jgi:hypothetical protein
MFKITLRIQEKEENTFSIMALKSKITSICGYAVNTEVDSALGWYRISG